MNPFLFLSLSLYPTSPPNRCEHSVCGAMSGRVTPGHTMPEHEWKEREQERKDTWKETDAEIGEAEKDKGSYDSGRKNGDHAMALRMQRLSEEKTAITDGEIEKIDPWPNGQ